MKKSPEQRIALAVDSAAKGFTTKAAKKDALEQLNRAFDQVSREGNVSYFERPSNLCHVRPKHAEAFGPVWGQVEILVELRKEINAIEVTKVSKVDNTKVRELGPHAATAAGIDFLDSSGDRRGYCYCCGRVGFKLNDAGRLSRHGYSRPGWGYDVGGCQGTRKTPEQTLDLAIDFHKHMIVKHEELLATDLIAFALFQDRRQRKQHRAEGRRTYEVRGDYTRTSRARAYQVLRSGDPNVTSITSPAVWRRTLERQLDTHLGQLRDLQAVKAGI
tara:strand:- start:98 stop:919 length:822 start_codon:yes stop_codon:yes gene_type:complete